MLDGWCHNRKHFAIDVYYDNNDKNLPNPFEILFYKSKGIEKKEEYPNEIKLILNSLKFEWEDDKDSSGYWISEKTEEDTITVIKNLCKKLQGLTQWAK